jgi:hypothetical protein
MSTTIADSELGERTHESYDDQLKAERGALGLDADTALPTAADDAGDALPADVTVAGSADQLSFAGIGGKKPEESKLRITGGAFAVEGQFSKGEDIIIEVKARVGEVKFTDTVDSKTGQATSCTRGHSARVMGALVVDQDTAGALESLQEAVRGFLAGDVRETDLAALVGSPVG